MRRVATKSLRGIRYKILESSKIFDYVISVADKEWECLDFVKYGNDLKNSGWVLRKIKISAVKTNKKLLKSAKYQKDLGKRIKKIKLMVSEKKPMPPLILRRKDFLIFDGYARYHVLKELGIKECFAYVRTKKKQKKQTLVLPAQTASRRGGLRT